VRILRPLANTVGGGRGVVSLRVLQSIKADLRTSTRGRSALSGAEEGRPLEGFPGYCFLGEQNRKDGPPKAAHGHALRCPH
jgi:hypothetical protein